MVESHVRAERAVLGARRRDVERADVAVYSRPGIHRPKSAADRCGITTTGGDQQIAVSQPKHKAVRIPIAIEISPEHDISCRVDCLHWITGECQAEAFSTVDRIEEHDDFAPISRSSREPTRVERLGSRPVIRKKGDLSGIVNCSGLHIEIGSTDRRGIRNLDVPFIDLACANDDAAFRDTTAHDGAERNLI